MADVSTLIAWCNMKMAESEREAMMARGVGMASLAEPHERDAKFYRTIVHTLRSLSKQEQA